MTAPRPAQRFRGDDGSAIVEAALVTPIFFLLILAILEFGMIFRDYLTVSDTTTDAARTGAVVGKGTAPMSLGGADANADFFILQTIRNGLGAMPNGWIKQIVVFRGASAGAGDPLSQITTACKNATVTFSGCNVYPPFQAMYAVQTQNASFFNCASQPYSCGFNPATRKNGDGSTVQNPNIEYVGVYVRIDRKYISKLFGDNFTLQSASVQRLEPGYLD